MLLPVLQLERKLVLCWDWLFIVGGYEIGHRLFFIDTEKTCIGPDKTFVENATRQEIEIFFLQGLERSFRDLGGLGNLLQGHTPHFALAPHPVAKNTHLPSLLSRII